MADEQNRDVHLHESSTEIPAPPVETSDRGIFDFMKKDDHHDQKDHQDAAMASDFQQKVHVAEPEHKEEEKKPSLLEKLHRSDSSSSSSSDEEEGDEDEKKKRREKKKEKKSLKEKIEEKLPGHKEEGEEHHDTTVPIEKCDDEKPPEKIHVEEFVHSEPSPAVEPEKKGFIDKIKEKIPVGGAQPKKAEEQHVTATPPAAVSEEEKEKEKKGFLDKIKEKIPGFHHSDKEKHEESASS